MRPLTPPYLPAVHAHRTVIMPLCLSVQTVCMSASLHHTVAVFLIGMHDCLAPTCHAMHTCDSCNPPYYTLPVWMAEETGPPWGSIEHPTVSRSSSTADGPGARPSCTRLELLHQRETRWYTCHHIARYSVFAAGLHKFCSTIPPDAAWVSSASER